MFDMLYIIKFTKFINLFLYLNKIILISKNSIILLNMKNGHEMIHEMVKKLYIKKYSNLISFPDLVGFRFALFYF